MNEYILTIQAACPVDRRSDTYQATVVSTHTIPVEQMQAVIDSHTKVPVFQEQLTHDLARALRARVTTEGHHGPVLVRSTWGRP